MKLRAGKYLVPVKVAERPGLYYFAFDYNKTLLAEIKAMEGAKWEGDIGQPDSANYKEATCPSDVILELKTCKVWRVPKTPHNLFQLAWLQGGNPYSWYDRPLADLEIKPKYVKAYAHQKTLAQFFITYRRCVAAADTGIGKTLSMFMALEEIQPESVWWISSASGVRATEREVKLWQPGCKPRIMTYERLLSLIKENPNLVPPQVIVFDEAHKVKTPTAQRSQAALALADACRAKWGDEACIYLMTGTPAPKAPTDWWHLCRIACPGFLREGTIEKFRARLAIVVARENQVTGGMFPQLLSWKDDETKCEICGRIPEGHDLPPYVPHTYRAAPNEVTMLYKRMKGLVLPMFKKDCLDLPDKRYEVIRLEPTGEMKRLAKMIVAQSSRTIERLTLLRELSDGFQYRIEDGPLIPCPGCKGNKTIRDYTINENEEYVEGDIECPLCDGSGQTNKEIRSTIAFTSPKEDALRDLLDAHESAGRFVVYGGFTGTIDRIREVCHGEKWATVRADGRGWVCTNFDGAPIKVEPLTLFQDMLEQFPRVVFCGHPESAGEGITLTRSPGLCFYSNDFNFKSRAQAEDRIHRIGMDKIKGATIYDLCCLETDYLVLNNLRAKKRLQHMTLTGEMFE